MPSLNISASLSSLFGTLRKPVALLFTKITTKCNNLYLQGGMKVKM